MSTCFLSLCVMMHLYYFSLQRLLGPGCWLLESVVSMHGGWIWQEERARESFGKEAANCGFQRDGFKAGKGH